MFKGEHVNMSKADLKGIRAAIQKAKGYDDMERYIGQGTGEEEFREIVATIEKRAGQRAKVQVVHHDPTADVQTEVQTDDAQSEDTSQSSQAQRTPTSTLSASDSKDGLHTPPTRNVDPSVMNAPLAPANELRMPLPAMVTGELPTPTPTPRIGC